MNKNDLYFYIQYCNHKENYNDWKTKKVVRKLRHNELFLITGGTGYITFKNKQYTAKEGMLFYFRPGAEHSIETDTKDPLKFLSVHFSYVHVIFEDNKWNLRTESKPLKLHSMQYLADYFLILQNFKKLVQTWVMKLPNYEFIAKALLQKLLFEIYENTKRENDNYSTTLKVEAIIKYMHENINHTIKLDDISSLTSLSSTYLAKIFKEVTGYSIIQFFNKMKIDKAKEIIALGDKKINEVSQMLGFKDEFYFSRLFKKIEGISPKDFYNKNVHGY
ncbi:MAG: AraC family transcriptional regulator [Clostridium sp.]|nr:AraC family transcriptional regulator [Clostridium sp.]